MAEAASPAGGSVSTTTLVSGGTGVSLVLAQYFVHPSWPPPDAVLTMSVTLLAPLGHLLGRAIYRRIEKWASDIDPTDDVPIPPAGGAR